MSGGSYDYAYSRIDDHAHWASILESMAERFGRDICTTRSSRLSPESWRAVYCGGWGQLKIDRRELPIPLKLALSSGKIRKLGHRRSTTYLAA